MTYSPIMSSYLKGAVAGVPGRLQSLHSSSYLQLPRNIQFPSTAGLQTKTSNLHARNPKAFIIFLILVFLLFWRNIITDVCSHFIQRVPTAPVETNPIKNSTLGVCCPIHFITHDTPANLMHSSRKYLSFHCQNEQTGGPHCSLPLTVQTSP